jgi:hypothetical protein
MIKVASNIQRMLVKQAQSAAPSSIPAPQLSPRMSPNNFYAPMQRGLQQDVRALRSHLNQGLSALDQGYSDMVGPDGIPLLLSKADRFAGDTHEAAPLLANDYSAIPSMYTNFVNQGAGVGNQALNYVEQQIPAAQASGRTIVDAATGAANQVAPYVQQYGQAVNNAATGLGSRLRDIGKGLLNNPLGR